MHGLRRQTAAVALAGAFAAVAAATACTNEVVEPPPPPPPDPSVIVDGLFVSENPQNVLSFYVEWESDRPWPTSVHVLCDSGYDQTFGDDVERTNHLVYVMGLVAESTCAVTVHPELEDVEVGGTRYAAADVGTLPDDYPGMSALGFHPDEVEPGWTLVNLIDNTRSTPLKLAVLDDRGRYRWHHTVATTRSGSDNSLVVTSQGILMGGTPNIDPRIIDWEGGTVWEEELPSHHDMRPDGGDENLLLYLQFGPWCDGVNSSAVRVWDRERREDVWSFLLCEHYLPDNVRNDWDHMNTVAPFPGEDALLLSARNDHALFKIDRDSGTVLWRLGPGGDIKLPTDDEFIRQHAPEIQPDGTILLFDNGLRGRRDYSRAIQIAYDETEGTAELVWEFRPDPDIYSHIWGDADRLPGGTTLITFGRPGRDLSSFVIEASVDGSYEVHRLETDPGWGIYRADRIEPRYGFVIDAEG